jgi:hypothetical protein
MSNTYKHKKAVKLKKYYKDRWETERYKVAYEYESYNNPDVVYTSYKYLEFPGVKPKQRKEVDVEYHWMTTPQWWIHLMHNKPQRRQQHLLEKAALRAEDLEDFEIPDTKRKPHKYFY